LKAGDEVIVPAVSWSTTYYPLQQYGLKLKFVDIDKDTLNLDLTQLESAITENTKAIFAVNLLGNPIDYKKVESLIEGKDIYLLEDNCESLGATLNGKQAGTFGVMGTYSSFFSHHISTMEGGLIATDDEELYHILLSIRSHGWTRHLPKDNKVVEKSDNAFHESFRFVLPGYNVRPLDMSGALGKEQLRKLPAIISGRQENAKFFVETFSKIEGISIQKETGNSSWFGFAIICDAGSEMRDKLVEALTNEGVDCRPIVAGDFTKNEVMSYFDYELHGEMKNASLIDSAGFFIGNHHYDVKDKLTSVAHLIEKTLKS